MTSPLPSRGNLLGGLPVSPSNETFESLVETGGLLVERIVSAGHASPPGFWYDQPRDEWVMVVRGAARLSFASGEAPMELGPGDWVHLPAHCRHRVDWTTPEEPTVWLAIHFEAEGT